MDFTKYENSEFNGKLRAMVNKANSIRLNKKTPTDITFADLLERDYDGMDVNAFYETIGVDPNFDTIENIFNQPDADVRWLIPELIRDALRLGYRSAPIWPNVIAAEESVSELNQILPSLNMSAATPKRVGEGETIPLGTISYGSKKFSINKYGRGISLTDEVRRYVNLNVVSIYLQDFGVKMGQGVDNMALTTLINGEQSDGSEAAPTVGVTYHVPGGTLPSPNPRQYSLGVNYRDLLRVWFRMAKLGRSANALIMDEEMGIDLYELPQLNSRTVGGQNPDGNSEFSLNLQTTLPSSANGFLWGGMNANKIMVLDSSAALIKMNAVPLMVESERIVSNQTQAFYASFTLGFAKLFTDAAVLIDKSVAYSATPGAAGGFPTAMSYDTSAVDMDSNV